MYIYVCKRHLNISLRLDTQIQKLFNYKPSRKFYSTIKNFLYKRYPILNFNRSYLINTTGIKLNLES